MSWQIVRRVKVVTLKMEEIDIEINRIEYHIAERIRCCKTDSECLNLLKLVPPLDSHRTRVYYRQILLNIIRSNFPQSKKYAQETMTFCCKNLLDQLTEEQILESLTRFSSIDVNEIYGELLSCGNMSKVLAVLRCISHCGSRTSLWYLSILDENVEYTGDMTLSGFSMEIGKKLFERSDNPKKEDRYLPKYLQYLSLNSER